MKLTDEEVVGVLAERDGWTSGVLRWLPRTRWPDYLESRDALAPVLEKLTPEEWKRLGGYLPWPEDGVKTYRHLLTIPPRDLAHAIAEAIRQ